MGTRGPLPGRSKLRIIRGTGKDKERKKPKGRAARDSESTPPPVCPAGVSPAVAALWLEIVAVLAKEERLTPGVGGLVLAYAGALANLLAAEEALADGKGLMVTVGVNGCRQIRQEFALARHARAQVLKLGAALGLNPAADARLPKPSEEDTNKGDAWDAL